MDLEFVADIVIPLSSAVIAFAALAFAVSESRRSRAHDRAMNLPYLDFEMHFNETEDEVGLWILNKGLGPALISEFRLHVDGRPAKESVGKIQDLWPLLGFAEGEKPYLGFFSDGNRLMPGRKHGMLTLCAQPYSTERNERVRAALRRISFSVKYESLLGDLVEPAVFDGPSDKRVKVVSEPED